MQQVKVDDQIRVHYTGKLENGEIFDTSLKRDPIEFKVGEGSLIPGFENGVIGMEKDETRTIKIPSDEAYGPVQQELFQEIPKNNLPEDLAPKQGMELVSKYDDGREIVVRVAEVKDDSIVIDANHPLAGEDLTFEVTLVEIVK